MVPFIQRFQDIFYDVLFPPSIWLPSIELTHVAGMTRPPVDTANSVKSKRADVAQLVEQLIRNQQVIGSSPIVGSKYPA